MDEETQRTETGDEALLREIREDYRYFCEYWAEARKERQIDLRYLCGQPWEPDDLKARKDAGRPAINHDELNQYVNQGVNNLRQNKRGIKVEPRGNGADDKTAEFRQDKIRTIEDHSRAQDVYLRAGQDMFEGSYGFFRITRKYVVDDPDPKDPHAFDQEILLKPISNADSVLYDPNCKEADWSDAKKVFVLDPMPTADFKTAYPGAQKTDFTGEDMRTAPGWISDKNVMVAEYWRVESTFHKIGTGRKVRTVERKKVVQYLTNGVEILDRIEQPGKEIPIPAMVGQERYVEEGGITKRKLFSLVRLARDPQMSLAYLNSQEMEEAGLSPKTPVRGWTGQFETDSEAHETAHKIPHAFIQYDYPEWAIERGISVALPQRDQFVPNFQQYEVAKDSCRRAVQASIGSSPLPTAAQRRNEKSGLALEHMEDERAIGSLHFGAGFDRAIERAGRIIDSWIPVIYDNEREEWLHKADDSRRHVRLNTEQPYLNEKTGEMEHFPIGEEDHDLSVSTGPSYKSEREAVDKFLDTLIAGLPNLPIPPPAAAKLLAMAIQMKDLGPKGDQMAEIISPTEGDQSQALQGLQQKAQQQGELLQAMQSELQKLQLEKQGKVIDNEYALKLKDIDIQAKLAVAEITTKAQSLAERMAFVEEFIKQQHAQAHDAGMQAEDHAHEQGLAQQAHQNGMEQQDAAAQQQQAAAEQQPDQQVSQ